MDAISRSQAVIEFQLDGTIVHANENFLRVLGYSLPEIEGRHHSMFVAPADANSPEYREFWAALNRGEFRSGEFHRVGKGGKEVWIQASYNPVFDRDGKPYKVVKFAAEITQQKLQNADYQSQISAIGRSQATIEFTLDGIILSANSNFLNTLGYSLDEIRGKHHSLFVEPKFADTVEYRRFWDSLRTGEFQSAEYKRIGKGGKEVWIQASYNPIFDLHGKPYKVVKYATDITSAKNMEFAIAETQKRDTQLALELQQKVSLVLDIVNAVADGKFDVEIPEMGTDAMGQVANALKQAVLSMKSALSEVRVVAATVATASQELNGAAREITCGAQSQASSLEETASSLEEITSAVKQNSDNAQQARQLANGSRDVAEKGGGVVGETVQAMSEINRASTKIADIITAIDEIAFQTNLLALNAAVEAARAGEQGRGFAVVAAEVRNLAQRSASAAKEIKALIQDSMRKVEVGTELVNRSGACLGEIVSSVKRVTDIVAEIAAASKEQLTGIEQVNKAVAQMDRVTQGNASQTEEMSGTAESLLSHSTQLSNLVSRFRLGTEDAMTSPTRSSPSRQPSTTLKTSRSLPPIATDLSSVNNLVGAMEF